jgi:hypothetical protein
VCVCGVSANIEVKAVLSDGFPNAVMEVA